MDNVIELKLIEKSKETTDIYTFEFEALSPCTWKSGQHGVFRFPDDRKNFRIFSIASDQQEGRIIISTRIDTEPSNFKKRLKGLSPGDIILMDTPKGNFCLNETCNNAVLVAGGIGITPYRSFLKQIDFCSQKPDNIVLLYIDSHKEYAYRDFLDEMDEKYGSSVELHYLSNRQKLNEKLYECIKRFENNAQYFISGSPSMVEDIKAKILSEGIDKSKINTDKFMGYD